MARKKKNRQTQTGRPPAERDRARSGAEGGFGSGETRASEAATILWMLTFLATVLAIVLVLLVGLGLRGQDAWEGLRRGLTPLMRFVGCVTATLCLVLTPVVYYQRKVLPPLAITWAAILAASAHWAMTLFNWPGL